MAGGALGAKQDLWAAAFSRLAEEEKAKLSPAAGGRHKVLVELNEIVQEKLSNCLEKRWKFVNRKDNVVVVRDLFEKLARSVKCFADTVDVAVQYDPVHAALPWAGVRFLLQIAIRDVQTWGLMIEGVERVANLITRYALVEDAFVTSNSTLSPQLTTVMTDLYTLMLQYLIRSSDYFGRSTLSRHIRSGFGLTERNISSILDSINRKDQDAQVILGLLETERNNKRQEDIVAKIDNLQHLPDDIRNLQAEFGLAQISSEILHARAKAENDSRLDDICQKLQAIRIDLEAPLVRLAARLEQEADDLNRQARLEVLQWLSNVPHRRHHKNMIKDLLQGSGAWLEKNDAFNDWRKSSSSAIVWLHGIPGSGKSKLVARVVDMLQNAAKQVAHAAPLAYFYCARATAEPKRADPDEIFRSILKQISCSTPDEPIPPLILDEYRSKKLDAEQDGCELELLSVEECVELIIKVADRTSLTIVIDALDECNPELRHLLLHGLESIVASSSNLVKLFVSSRDDADIAMRLSKTPNVYIRATDSAADIQRFAVAEVDAAIEQQRLLFGNVSTALREKVISALVDRAHGMFLSVTLQIEALCDHHRIGFEGDVLKELARSPRSLHQLWSDAMDRILSRSTISRNAALNTLRWIFGARVALPRAEFVKAISKMCQMELDERDILNVSHNLVIVDTEMDIFRYAHLSVREFLETTEAFAGSRTQSTMALHCLKESIETVGRANPGEANQKTDGYAIYTSIHWPIHCFLARHDFHTELRSTLRIFLSGSEVTTARFGRWLEFVSQIPTIAIEKNFRHLFQLSLSKFKHPIFLAIAWDFSEVFDDIWTSEVNSRYLVNQFNLTPLALACNLGHIQMATWLIERGAVLDVTDSASDPGLWTPIFGELRTNPLAAAVFMGIMSCVAARLGDIGTIRDLLRRGASANGIESGPKNFLFDIEYSPLVSAVQQRHTDVSRLLLEAGANPNIIPGQPGHSDVLPIERACYNGDLQIVEDLLEHGADLHASIPSLGTPLSSAALAGNEHVVKLLLRKGADPNLPCSPYGNAFLAAVAGGNSTIIYAMLRRGADVNLGPPPHYGEGNALSIAIGCGHLHVWRLLLEQGADPIVRFRYYGEYFDAMTFSAGFGSSALTKEFLEFFERRGWKPNLADMLLAALAHNKPETAQLLLDAGAEVNTSDESETTPLHFAVLSSPIAIVKDLLSRGAEVNKVNQKTGSILQTLCARGAASFFAERSQVEDNAIFQLLIDKGATFEHEGGRHDSFLQSAAYEHRPYFIARALQLGAIPRTGAGLSGGPYHAAAARGDLEAFAALPKSNLDINITCPPFGTVLAAAACRGRRPATARLQHLEDPGSVWERLQDKWDFQNDMRRIRGRVDSYDKISAILLEAGGDVETTGGYFGNALQAAAYVGNHDLVQALLNAGAKQNAIAGFYGSALQAAAAGETETWWVGTMGFHNESVMMLPEEEEIIDNHAHTVDILLAAGADVSARGGFFGSCLQAAVHSDNVELVERLLSAGAVVHEDGEGFYGGCLSAAISFGKRELTRVRPWRFKSNAEKILSSLLRRITISEYADLCERAIHHAIERKNDEGLALLRKVASTVALERELDWQPPS